jgi:hypothetical protein
VREIRACETCAARTSALDRRAVEPPPQQATHHDAADAA